MSLAKNIQNFALFLFNTTYYYATHRFDVRKIATPFRIRLKSNAKLRTQRPTKVSIHYKGKLKETLDELEHHNTIRQVGSFSSDNPFIVFIVLPFLSIDYHP